ncbi:MAG: ribulose-phosphate 3-epimerase [Prevotella sp.]|nr:ribulose-phosphate 3-epimerase [Prevotella sp.]
MEKIVSASILSADFLNLGSEIKRAEGAGCRYIHFDVMDGVFVPNISYGLPVLKAVSRTASAVLDVHLMITDPLRYAEKFAENGADIITFHIESKSDTAETIEAIRSLGKKAGLALKPGTPLSEAEKYIDMIDMLLIMTVEPGFGGQSFIPEMREKIAAAKKLIADRGLDVLIEVDGGINGSTAETVKNAGADVLVAGSYLFKARDIGAAARILAE